jgi:LysR family nod box-dependent transcriptional activator
MKLNALDLNLLFTLEVLLDERNVSRAAQKLGVSQSAVSIQLSHLRRHFDDQLFVSSGRGLKPTLFCLELEQALNGLLHKIREFSAHRQHFDPVSAERRFRVRAGHIDTCIVVAEAQKKLLKLAPNIFLSQVADAGDLKQVDFHIIPKGVHRPELPMEDLYEDEYVAVVCANSPRFKEGLTFSDYEQATHLVRRAGITNAPSLEAIYAKELGIERKEGPIIDSYSVIPYLLLGTDYITTIPRQFAERLARLHPLRIFPLPFEFPRQTLVLQWNTSANGDRATRWFKELLLETAAEIYPALKPNILENLTFSPSLPPLEDAPV